MKLCYFVVIAALLTPIAILAIACGASRIQMVVTVNGLGKGEEAILRLSPEIDTAKEVLFEQTIRSDGGAITVDIHTSLKDGYYQLLLEAPDKYFRDPKGYFFQVYQSKIVNPTGQPIVFNLIPPPSEPCLEAFISLSAPEKPPPPKRVWIRGSISGLLNKDDLVTIHVYYVDTGWEKLYGTREGNGPLEIPLDNSEEGIFYTITVEAKGYTTLPASYTIRIEGETAYVVRNNEIGEEALHIDFQFIPDNP